jgi:hypothetical protein
LALVYYADPAQQWVSQRDRMPTKPSYPTLRAPDAGDGALACDGLAVELARAESLRWFARNEGAMAYTDKQRLERHAANFAEDVAITAAVIIMVAAAGGGGAGLGGGGASSGPPEDPSHRTLESQVGGERLRWAVTAADSRILGLLRLRRDKGCAERPTLVAGRSDLQNLLAIEDLRRESAARPSDEAMMHEVTHLLDELGPLALADASNRNCGMSNCSVIRSIDAARDHADHLRDQAIREANAGALVQEYSGRVTWTVDDGAACELPKFQRWNQGTEVILGTQALMWASEAASGPWWASVRLSDIDAVLPVRRQHSLHWIALKKRDGSCLFLAMHPDGRGNAALAETVSGQIDNQLNLPGRTAGSQLSANP